MVIISKIVNRQGGRAVEAPRGGLGPQKFLDEFNRQMDELYELRRIDDKIGMYCQGCDMKIKITTLHISMHVQFGAGYADSGETKKMQLPYCLSCEGPPKKTNTHVIVPAGINPSDTVLEKYTDGRVRLPG